MDKLNIAYARQSMKQGDRDASTVGQIQAISQYALQENLEVHDHIEDIASGKSLSRQGIQTVIELTKQDKLKTVIVWRLDRLARNTKDLLDLFELFDNHKVKVVSLNDTITDYDNSLDRFKVQLLASVAQWQREIISENKQLGMKQKFEQGHIISTSAPFGYRYSNQQFHIIPDQAYTVKAVFHMYLNGLGYKRIAQRTKEQLNLIPRTPQQVRSILTNPKYTGHYHSKYGVLYHKLPTIVAQEIFNEVKVRIERKPPLQKYQVETLLRKKVICPYCSKTMTTYHYRKQPNSTPKFSCPTKFQGQYDDCPMGFIVIRQLEHQVLQLLIDYLISPKEISRLSHLVEAKIKQKQKKEKRLSLQSISDKTQLINDLAAGKITQHQFTNQMSKMSSKQQSNNDIPALQTIQDTLRNLEQLMKNHKTLKQHLFQLVQRVELEKNGEVTGVFLTGIKENIKNFSIKETIDNENIND